MTQVCPRALPKVLPWKHELEELDFALWNRDNMYICSILKKNWKIKKVVSDSLFEIKITWLEMCQFQRKSKIKLGKMGGYSGTVPF